MNAPLSQTLRCSVTDCTAPGGISLKQFRKGQDGSEGAGTEELIVAGYEVDVAIHLKEARQESKGLRQFNDNDQFTD